MQLSPSFLMTWASTPAAGAGTSRTTLSVSISIRSSSISTAWPGFFFHCRRVASATDSDSCGTFTSINAILFALLFPPRRRAASDGPPQGQPPREAANVPVRRERASFRQHETFQLAERLFEEGLLLLLVQVCVADRRRRRRRPPGVAELLAIGHVLVDVVLDEEPGALVLRLVLAPDDLGEVGVLLHLGREGLVRERVELLDADERDVGVLPLGAGADEVVVDLPRAGDQPLDTI